MHSSLGAHFAALTFLRSLFNRSTRMVKTAWLRELSLFATVPNTLLFTWPIATTFRASSALETGTSLRFATYLPPRRGSLRRARACLDTVVIEPRVGFWRPELAAPLATPLLFPIQENGLRLRMDVGRKEPRTFEPTDGDALTTEDLLVLALTGFSDVGRAVLSRS